MAPAAGEVYRARDSKLLREVAIKILPPAVSADPERLARFERVARVLASLNHPNIGAIYGVEDAAGIPALILELAERTPTEGPRTEGPRDQGQKKPAPSSDEAGSKEIIPAVTYSPTQFPTQYHRR